MDMSNAPPQYIVGIETEDGSCAYLNENYELTTNKEEACTLPGKLAMALSLELLINLAGPTFVERVTEN